MTQQTGSITGPRKDGRWLVRWWEDDDTGQRVRRSGYARSEDDAKRLLRGALTRVERGQTGLDSRMRFRVYADRWKRDTLAARDVAEATTRVYTVTLDRWVLPALGDLPLSGIRKSHIERMLARIRGAGRSTATARTAYTVARMVLQSAVDDDLLGVNPAERVPRPASTRSTRPVPDRDQVRAVLAASTGRLRVLLHLVAYTGARVSEALDARWADLDLDEGTWRVRGTKTAGSARTVPLPGPLVAELRSWRRQQLEHRLAVPAWDQAGWVVTGRGGQRADYSNVRDQLLRLLEEHQDLPQDLRFHSFRHAAATLLLEERVPMRVVAELLGHSSTRLTADLYSHVRPDVARAAGDALGDALR